LADIWVFRIFVMKSYYGMANIQLDVEVSEMEELIEFYTAKRKKLVDENALLFAKYSEYSKKIDSLQEQWATRKGPYPARGSWGERIYYVLKGQIDGLSVKEIVIRIMTLEGGNMNDDYKRIYASVAPTLSMGVGIVYERQSSDNKDYIYKLKK
jgi:hypothetical protein